MKRLFDNYKLKYVGKKRKKRNVTPEILKSRQKDNSRLKRQMVDNSKNSENLPKIYDDKLKTGDDIEDQDEDMETRNGMFDVNTFK